MSKKNKNIMIVVVLVIIAFVVKNNLTITKSFDDSVADGQFETLTDGSQIG